MFKHFTRGPFKKCVRSIPSMFRPPPSLVRFRTFSRYPLPLSVHIFNFSTPSKHMNILFISVSSKFATFDPYLIGLPLKIASYLCKNNWECDLGSWIDETVFRILYTYNIRKTVSSTQDALRKYLPCEIYTSVCTFFEEPPSPCTCSCASLITPSLLHSVCTFKIAP